jgi:hypothetical protein
MNKIPMTISGPYIHENLAIFLFHGPDQLEESRYISLDKAFEKKHILVHETGAVGHLEAENLSDGLDVFIQAGDVLKGGRQDRTIAIDFIVPAKSGRVTIPSFCVESGRWHKRRREDDGYFGSSTQSIHTKSLRMAAKLAHDQAAVWHSVAESQEALSSALKKSVHAADSPTSYQLSVEDADLVERKRKYQQQLGRLPENAWDTVGYAFYVNGIRNTMDIYASTELFHQFWDKLLDIAILEAIAAKNGTGAVPDGISVDGWLREAATARLDEATSAPPRTYVQTKSYQVGVVFNTFDRAVGDGVILHTNIISR